MEMLRPDAVPDSVLERSLRTSRTAATLLFVLCVSAAWIPLRLSDWYMGLSTAVALTIAPLLIAGLFVWFSVTWGMAQKMFGAWRAGWLMAVGPDGVYLNIRHGSPRKALKDEPSVVLIPHREIASAGRLWDRFDVGSGEELGLCDLELRLRHEDTIELCNAVRAESEENASRLWLFGPDVAIDVPEAGVIRVDWRGPAMINALKPHVPIADHEVLPQATPARTREDTDAKELEPV